MAEIHVDSVGLSFGTYPVIRDISFKVESGQFVALVGPTGCGKSSVLNIVAGLIQPSIGTIGIGGRQLECINRMAAYMFQSDALLPWKTALENIMLGPLLCGASRILAAKDANLWLERVGLRGLGERYPSQLSGGQRKRVAMAQALDRKSTRLNSSHIQKSRMPSSA